jgi:cephalosporin-C deacetylase-like acetyl esterase
MTVREYLCREARHITDRALADDTDEAVWQKLLPERRRQFLEMMGLEDLPAYEQRTPPGVTVTGVVERPLYRIEKLYYESLPQLYVTANLYVPKTVPGQEADRFPAVLYVCGHSETQKVHYQAHPRRFAELGFVCLAVETVQLGEVRGHHHGCYRQGWWHWYSRGYTPGGIELLNGIRGLDLLAQRPDVDPDRLGVTGISGGGAVSWYVAAGDARIKVVAPVCGTATLASHIQDRTIDGHCDCMWWINTYRWDLADVGALIAPRPLMIASADRDEIFTIASIQEVHAQLRRLYALLGAEESLHLVETPGGHSYHERSRTAIFSLFLKHLQGRDVPPEMVGDIDDSPEREESEETLRVFRTGPRPEDRTPTIQDTFVTLPSPPRITDAESLERTRRQVVSALRAKTFRAFPADPPPLDVQTAFAFQSGANACQRFAYTSEAGWRLQGVFRLHAEVGRPAPAVLALRSPEEARGATERFLLDIRASWAKVIVEPRGTGDTAWGQDLQWHLRRAAAWTGRTIAGMRVWDTLRALKAVRSLPEVDGEQLSLAAQGEMAAIALYAALLDGQVRTLLLQSPPATQDAPSRPDGRGEAIEMLNCLRITDLPQIAGLLYPTEIVLAGDCPDTYAWAEDLYERLDAPGRIRRVADLKEWEPT